MIMIQIGAQVGSRIISLQMNNQKVKVHYKEKRHQFDFDLIENLEQLRLAIKLRFGHLRQGYDIRLESPRGNFITNQEVRLLKQFKANDINLYIEDHKDDQLEIESISSDLQDIEILESQKESNSRNFEIPIRRSRESLKKQQNIKEVNGQISYPQLIEKPIKEKQDETLNEDVQCNGCFEFPIKGHIYKCLVCQDYDLCSKCEVNMHQFHPFLKITKKNQYPAHLKVTFSRRSKIQMEKMAEIDKINEQRRKRLKNQQEVSDYRVIDPSTLESKKVCARNFVSEIIGSV